MFLQNPLKQSLFTIAEEDTIKRDVDVRDNVASDRMFLAMKINHLVLKRKKGKSGNS